MGRPEETGGATGRNGVEGSTTSTSASSALTISDDCGADGGGGGDSAFGDGGGSRSLLTGDGRAEEVTTGACESRAVMGSLSNVRPWISAMRRRSSSFAPSASLPNTDDGGGTAPKSSLGAWPRRVFLRGAD